MPPDACVVHHGDCLDVLRGMPEASVDAVVTDPPYGLEFMGREWDAPWKDGSGLGGNSESGFGQVGLSDGAKRLPRPSFVGGTNPTCRNCGGTRRGNDRATRRACRCEAPSFPNLNIPRMRAFQDWCEAWAREVYRVMKPGAHLVAFGGTRTYHRLACAIEDAGFEVRDQLAWVYGTGFPKSLDVGKAIDRMRDDETPVRSVCAWLRARATACGVSNEDMDAALGLDSAGASASHWTAGPAYKQPRVPKWDQWLALKALLGFGDEMDAEVWRLNGRKGQPGEAWHEREFLGRGASGKSAIMRSLAGQPDGVGGHDITAPATDAAKQWQGFGTALKPSWEPIVLARKPLAEPTVAANVLKHGTGAINVDACRVGTFRNITPSGMDCYNARNAEQGYRPGAYQKGLPPLPTVEGRWPPNLCHDGSPEVLDTFAAFGERGDNGSGPRARKSPKFTNVYQEYDGGDEPAHPKNRGSAARFFYSAKASKAERAGSKHPTVKPVALMRWLCRLITPPGGTVLDPFAGSGTTGQAALAEGFSAVLIEREVEYYNDILARLARLRDETPLFAESHAA